MSFLLQMIFISVLFSVHFVVEKNQATKQTNKNEFKLLSLNSKTEKNKETGRNTLTAVETRSNKQQITNTYLSSDIVIMHHNVYVT